MAITNNGTVVRIAASDLPSGYTKPTVTTFSDWESESATLTLSVLKSTVEDATATTTMANILANGTIGITKQVTDLVTADYIGTNTVDVYAELTAITTNLTVADDLFTDTAISYKCTVKYYVKTS